MINKIIEELYNLPNLQSMDLKLHQSRLKLSHHLHNVSTRALNSRSIAVNQFTTDNKNP